MASQADSFILLVLAFIFPPAAVAIITGCGPDLILNLLLTLIGWLPGCIHAFWLIFKRSEANQTYGQNRWTYSGMGEYHGIEGNAAEGQKQPPQPSTGAQEQAPPPSGPPPADQKQAPPPATEEKKQGEKSTPQDNQKATQVDSSQSTSDQKATDPVPQYTPIASSSA